MAININGDGLIELGGTSTTQGRVRLAEDTDNGTNYVELTAPASVTSNRTVTFPDADVNFSTGLGVAQGGTGATTLTANNVILGNGTSAVTFVAPGTSGNVLTSNGTTWASTTPSVYAGPQVTTFTGNGTFTIPSGITRVKVTVVGGGGGGGGAAQTSACSGTLRFGAGGGGGGAAIKWLTGLTPGNTISVTVGSGGTAGSTSNGNGGAGGSSQVASGTQTITTVSATGGALGSGAGNGDVNGGSGGIGSSGDLNIKGNGGECGSYNTSNGFSGGGGSSILGGGGKGQIGGSTGEAGGAYGGGGGGGSSTDTTARAGGAGAAGVVMFEY